MDNRWRNAWNAVYVAGGWRLVQPNWAAMQVQTKVGTWGHNVNCNCDGNRGGNSKCKNNGGHNGRANGNEMDDMALILTSDDAKARRNRPSTENFRTLGKNILSLKARQKRKLGHFRIKKRTKRTRRHVKSYGVVWTNVDRPV